MANFVNRADNDFVNETILGTPLPQATSTVNNNGDRYASFTSAPPNQSMSRGSTSRLTGTIENLKSFSEALAFVRKSPDGKDHSLLSVTDASFGQRVPSRASLGVLDIDALLGNEVLDNSQEIMEQLYKTQHKYKSQVKDLGNTELNNEVQGLPSVSCQQSVSSKFCSETTTLGENDSSALGVPSFLLRADNSVSEDGSFSEASSIGFSKGSYLNETSEEVAAIMGKDCSSSFDSGRISFEPCEVSARSTSLGLSSSDSKLSNSSIKDSWSNMGTAHVDEVFISDEDGILKQLERDEKSFAADFLPPIDPDMIPGLDSSRLSTFSEVHDGEKIMVRPSWIGIEDGNDDPINISVGQYFRMKTDVLPNNSGHLTPDQRPNFGMKITSPRRREKGIPLVSDSFDASFFKQACEPPIAQNTTQDITPKLSPRHSSKNETSINEASPEAVNLPPGSSLTLSCIDNILKQINTNDSPNTIANKFLRYSLSTNSRELNNTPEHLVGNCTKNNKIDQNLDNIAQKKNVPHTPKKIVSNTSDQGTGEGMAYSMIKSTPAKEPKNVKCEIPDLVQKLNSLERRGQKDKSTLKNVSIIVDKLRSNVAGPLDCSALYETLNNDLVLEGPLDCEMSFSPLEEGREAVMAQECNGSKCWIEVPEEILIAGEDNKLLQNLCVGLGFSSYVPLVNLTNHWLTYQVSPLKDSSDGDFIFQQLPIRTLLAPGSNTEFEVIIAPRNAGKHSAVLEIEVTNFMDDGDAPNQLYCTKLLFNSNIPKVVLLSDRIYELQNKETLNFGLLPEGCTKIVSLHLLNTGKSDIPVRIVVKEMPEAHQPFGICNASRLPISNENMLSDVDTEKLNQCGINLERKDLLSCDLSGSGSDSMVTFGLYFHPPRSGMNSVNVKDVSELTARLRVELDVPLNCASEFTVLKEVYLTGSVGVTKLGVGIESDPLILDSKERNILPQGTDGIGAIPKLQNSSPNIYPAVTKVIPICSQGPVPLDLAAFISLPDGEKTKVEDEMTVVPDSLSLQPGERSTLTVSYQPRTDLAYECNRILALQLIPNGPTYCYNLKGVCIPLKSRNSLSKEDINKAVQPAETRLEKVTSSLGSTPQFIQSTRTTLVWGSAPINSEYWKSSFVLRNPTQVLEKVLLAITGSDDYKLLNHESDMVRKTSFDLPPKQSKYIRVFFRPKRLGPSVGKLEITVYAEKELGRKIASKMMSLYGYGGSSNIDVIALPKDMAGRPWLNLGLIFSNSSGPGAIDFGTPLKTARSSSPSQSAPSLKSRLLIRNAGSLAAFVKIIPLKKDVDPESLSNLEEGREHFVTVRPDVFQLEPLTGINVWVSYVHGLSSHSAANDSTRDLSYSKGERALEEVAKLLILSGEVVTRIRLRKIYKTAEIFHANKSIAEYLNLNGTSLSFIGVQSNEGVVTELEGEELEPDGDEGEKPMSSLCDPATKDAAMSLMQNMKSTVVLLAVEKETGAKDSENDANATLIVQQGNNEFHSLQDDKDASPCIISSRLLNPGKFSSSPESCGKLWSIEPEGTVCLGAAHGTSSTLVLHSHTGANIIFEIRLGIVETGGSIEWIPPSHRQSQNASSILMVEPWQGQLLPYGCVQLKLFLQRDSNCPLLNGIMQVCSENDSLKVQIKIKGKSQPMIPERFQESMNEKSFLNRAFIMKNIANEGLKKHYNGKETPVLIRAGTPVKEPVRPEVPLKQKHSEKRNNSVYVETSTIAFPVTKVGSFSHQKLVIKNPTNEHFEVHILQVSEPFTAPSEARIIRNNFYLAMKIGFYPQFPGSFEQTVTIKVASTDSSKVETISVTLTGRSVL